MTTQEQSAGTGLSRRTLLGGGAAATLGIALSGSLGPLARASDGGHGSNNGAAGGFDGYGPLQPDPDGRLALPNGFHYTVVAEAGVTLLDSGEPTPDFPDGSVSFPRPGGGSIIITNHEVRNPDFTYGVPHLEGLTYDPGLNGGTTTIEVDKHGERVREYVSLAGTSTNCAGGKTPWNTWLSCEEVFANPPGFTKPHGFVFEVDPYDEAANLNPQPIRALGRFEHEAVAVDPDTGQIYETEDAVNPLGLFYRWTPPDSALPLGKGSLRALGPADGTLQALRARNASGAVVLDLSVATEPGTWYDVEWVDVADRDGAPLVVRRQFNGFWNGAPRTGPGGDITRSRKLEGAWWGDGGAYFVASFARSDDPVNQRTALAHDGQVWFYDPLAHTIELRLRFAYTPNDQDDEPDGPDNIALSPYGGVILAEDGEGKQHLVGATEDGHTYFLARNEVGNGTGEMTGPNFSPDKQTLFANLFNPGATYAITGPWKRKGGGGPPPTPEESSTPSV
jgi:secreted PhoX family phosphatase